MRPEIITFAVEGNKGSITSSFKCSTLLGKNKYLIKIEYKVQYKLN
jgi:hypothetical protein